MTDAGAGDGPVAVVTGGTRGIGAAVCRELDRAGHHVVAVARSAVEVEGAAEVVACDVTDPEAVADLFAAREHVNVLVNNAGAAVSNPLQRTTIDQWQTMLAVNATGPFLCSRAVVAGMRERGHGRIVTVASTAGLEGGAYITAYCASKHAAVGLTRALAAELDGTGVAAAAVCPTYVDTPMTDQTIATIRATTGVDEQQARRLVVDQTPHGRLLTPDEVATAVVDLVTNPDPNGTITILDGAP